jgi:galactonate dehydratase
MKIARVEHLHADAGQRNFDFLKITSDDGLVGWPFFEHQSVDVAIIDTPWNGVAESAKIAAMADAYEVNVAPHNFYGHLATLMNAHFCAVVPNLRIMEIDPDTVPWYDDLVTHKPDIKDGHLTLPTRPGWGTDVNEEAVRAHPPRKR